MEGDKPYTKFCYLCEEPLSDSDQTIDHVVPKSLFDQKKGLIELPTHKKCNNAISLDDEYFRLCMTAASVPNHPIAKKLWDGPVMRGFHRSDRPGLKAATLKALQPVDVHTPAGIYLGTREAMFQDAKRIQGVVNRITRGLYAKQTGRVLSIAWPVNSDLINSEAARPIFDLLKIRFATVGNGVFHYAWKCLEEDDREGFFWMVFYRQVHFWGYTGTKLREMLNPSLAQ
jgi:hypothetical protein